ncbi:MAG TPA: tRNA lysidine(34) synthetase TilS, partial [Candidatus Fimenecus stercoravium]|nr:tRNA lysidine(34) synthetase TilS [Candidatus Fimenecus stercoravium]
IESVHVEALLSLVGSGKSVTLPGACTVRSRQGVLECPPPTVTRWEQPLRLTARAQTVQTPAGTIHIRLFQQKDLQNLHKEYLANAVDCAKMNSNLVLRSRCSGDRFSDSARGITKTLKKWMNEEKIPPELRNAVPVLASGDQVLWVGGFGTNAPFAVSDRTQQCFVFMF